MRFPSPILLISLGRYALASGHPRDVFQQSVNGTDWVSAQHDTGYFVVLLSGAIDLDDLSSNGQLLEATTRRSALSGFRSVQFDLQA